MYWPMVVFIMCLGKKNRHCSHIGVLVINFRITILVRLNAIFRREYMNRARDTFFVWYPCQISLKVMVGCS